MGPTCRRAHGTVVRVIDPPNKELTYVLTRPGLRFETDHRESIGSVRPLKSA